ncbi:TIGR04255 family protein [Candidatus Chloroploca sp. M-50]|uniref:TIGR04255 family protein n=1 Tax=Candidatus Chloroploca mongolica TaxID=2528176 RepID=A0ABS4DHI1_9CHLR|nr:TIGR04255 family protein [Candidatus Chloroploca mongolica]MBP1468897.1 TIGR04255 family protein [Candidatus Chloroploca mongolica]
MRKVLKNKPLIEAILEIHWHLKGQMGDFRVDPHYTILLARLYDRFSDDYPHHEQLPTANIPVEIIGRAVQQRFRVAENSWPLVQLGPGVATLNDTVGYDWEKNFRERAISITERLFDAYPQPKDLSIEKLILRYIDGVEFDFEHQNIFEFLRDMMKIKVEIHEDLFLSTGVASQPLLLDLNFAFPSHNPEGVLQLRFTRGERENKSALIWETVFSTQGPSTPQSPEQIIAWADQAHQLTSDWFFKIIDGELLAKFA